MTTHEVVSKDEWVEARRRLLAKEKEFTHLRDQLSAERRALPWMRIDKAYTFDGPNGKETLAQLFGDRSQLVVYHFMFAPEWEVGCKSCSFWADNFNGITAHLRQRDVAFAAISRAPLADLERFRHRMGWQFKWVSSYGSDFNRDFGVTFTPEEVATGEVHYNYGAWPYPHDELPGISIFYRNDAGEVFHTYSTYGRGVEVMMHTYNLLDLTPKGRDEDHLEFTMQWVRHHDRYDPAPTSNAPPAAASCCGKDA